MKCDAFPLSSAYTTAGRQFQAGEMPPVGTAGRPILWVASMAGEAASITAAASRIDARLLRQLSGCSSCICSLASMRAQSRGVCAGFVVFQYKRGCEQTIGPIAECPMAGAQGACTCVPHLRSPAPHRIRSEEHGRRIGRGPGGGERDPLGGNSSRNVPTGGRPRRHRGRLDSRGGRPLLHHSLRVTHAHCHSYLKKGMQAS